MRSIPGGGESILQISPRQWLASQRHALVNGAWRQKARDSVAVRDLVPYPPQQFGSYLFHGPLGQHGPLNLAARVGQRGADGMQAVKPQSFCGFAIRPWVEMAAVFLGHGGDL
jgi:hypothetical protein